MIKTVVVITIALLVIGGGIYFFEMSDDKEIRTPLSLDGFFGSEGGSTEDEIEQTFGDNSTGSNVVVSNNSALPLTYQNSQFGFEMDLPKGYTGSSFAEGFGVTVLLRHQGRDESFQMFIAPFDEPGPITVNRIQQDLPNLQISGSQVALIGGGQIEALIFIGESEEFGKTREVWFVHGGQLFQVIAPFELEQTVGPILESLKFN